MKEGRLHPARLRRHHAQDLVQFVTACQARGEWIILAGDLNEVLGEDNAGLTQLHTECGLLDACLERHGVTEFSTYQRGTKVIDYILVDRNIMRCIANVGYEPFNLHIMSDHCGVFIDVATAQCFGSNILPLQPIQLCNLSTKRSHQIAPYFHEKHKHLVAHNWFQKIQQLRSSMNLGHPDHILAETLYDRLITSVKSYLNISAVVDF